LTCHSEKSLFFSGPWIIRNPGSADPNSPVGHQIKVARMENILPTQENMHQGTAKPVLPDTDWRQFFIVGN
jgi:hypothetical protein